MFLEEEQTEEIILKRTREALGSNDSTGSIKQVKKIAKMEEGKRLKVYIKSVNHPRVVFGDKDEEDIRVRISRNRLLSKDENGEEIAAKILIDEMELIKDQIVVWCSGSFTMNWVKDLIQDNQEFTSLVASEESLNNFRCTIKIRKRETPPATHPGWKIEDFAIRDKKEMELRISCGHNYFG